MQGGVPGGRRGILGRCAHVASSRCAVRRAGRGLRPAAARAGPEHRPAAPAPPRPRRSMPIRRSSTRSPARGRPASAGLQSSGGRPASASARAGPLAQPVSDAQIRHELAASGLTANSSSPLTPDGLADRPGRRAGPGAGDDQRRQRDRPPALRCGGGHGTFVDTAYDCSGSLSFVFAAAGILNRR